MSRSRKQFARFSPRTGTVKRGFRDRAGREGLSSQIEHEYGWDPRSSPPERLWLHAPSPSAAPEPEDGEPTRGVRTFSLVGRDES
jgi:hypothetical protein